MVKNKNKENKTPRKRGGENNGNFRDDRISYNGPIVMKKAPEQETSIRLNTSLTNPLTADGAGVIDVVFGSNGITSVGDWSSLAATWHECRVLGMRLEYVGNRMSASGSYNQGPGYLVDDRATAATLGSAQAAANHESVQLVSMRKNWKKTARMSGIEEAAWMPVGSMTAVFWIKLYAPSNTASQITGYYIMRYLAEFRGRA